MKNLTLRIDEKVLAEARKLAALRGTTVAKLVREFLEALAADPSSGRGFRTSDDDIFDERIGRVLSARNTPGFAEAPPPYEDDGVPEDKFSRPPTLEEMTTDTGMAPEPGYDAWFRAQVQRALDDKKAGAKYEDFAKVAAEFGFNAR